MKKIILASASPRRKELLDQIGIKYEVVVREVDEGSLKNMPPFELVQALARMKAKAVVEDISSIEEDVLIIGADTIVVLGNQILGKPKDSLDAKNMLSMLSGKMHIVYTGVAIIDIKSNTEKTFVESTKIYMKNMSQKDIQEYILTKEPLDKAGSYGIQGKGGVFIEKIEGDYFSVVGLPISKLYDCLQNFI